MSYKINHLKNLINANNDNNLAVFVGAGISKSSNTKTFKLPDWNDLIVDLKKELDLNDENDYLKIAQLYYLEFGEYTYYKKLKGYFPDYIKPSAIHNLIFELNPHIIITTNWDNILERAIEENAFIYDIVCSDVDLVKSSLQNKLVKMHGDFKNNNIVFKEDDYLNYQYNFPLIENYVKSILSTHTVLFLGYSYNDLNLKQIMKWLQNHSKVRPPMYLVTYNGNITQSNYLENHGITTLLLEDNDNKNKDPNDYSKRTLSFLERIKNQDELTIINSDSDTIDFIYKKLSPLKELDGILFEQIQKVLTNCRFLYDSDSLAILEFYNRINILDYDSSKITVYQNFIKILFRIDKGEIPSHKTLQIFEILQRANVKGIIITEDNVSPNNKEYIPFNNYIENGNQDTPSLYLDYNFSELKKINKNIRELFELSFKFYQLENFEEAYNIIDDVIVLCLKQRNYTLLFIAMFNKNIVLFRLKHSFKKDDIKYNNINEYDLKEKFNNLPKDLQFALQPLYDFLNGSFLYKYAYYIAKELKKKEDSKRIIDEGGMAFHSDTYKNSSKHKNLVSFVLRNKIMIEGFSEYKNINQNFVNIAIVWPVRSDFTFLNKIELYSCIKYVEYKELRMLLVDFYKKDSNKKGKLQISKEDKEWIINIVSENIVSQYIDSNYIFSKNEQYIENILFVLSLVKLDKEENDKILKLISKIIIDGNNTIGIFQSINLFIGVQYNLYKTEINEDTLLEIIEKSINKLVYKKYNAHEYRALTRNEMSNIYEYAKETKVIFTNDSLIDKLIAELNEFSLSDKLDICQYLLLSIYDISDEYIKETIKSYILNIDFKEEIDLDKRLVFELALVICNFKELDNIIISNLNEYMKQFEDGKRFSSILYTIDNQIDNFLMEKYPEKLGELSVKIKIAIERYEKVNLSLF